MIAKGLATAVDNVIGRNSLDDSISTPLMIIRQSALNANITHMADFCREHDVLLSPHAKTTMSPEIVRRQLAAGAWGITVAHVSQAIALEEVGAENILIANEVVDTGAINWIDRMTTPGNREIYCYVDSMEGADRLAAGITEGILNVLVEVGFPGGRGGVRSPEEAVEIATAIKRLPTLRLSGVAAFEGIIGGAVRDGNTEKEVRHFLAEIRDVAKIIASTGGFDEIDDVILSAGGSAYFDLVADELSHPILDRKPRVILRSGCYVTHDHGAYSRLSPLSGTDTGLRPAIEIISSVLSRPEPDLALCDIGRRDVPFDAGLPVPLWIRHAGRGVIEALEGPKVLRLNDQHAYVDVGKCDIGVGDRIAFGISHPCTAFDKWRVIPLVDEELTITELIHTVF